MEIVKRNLDSERIVGKLWQLEPKDNLDKGEEFLLQDGAQIIREVSNIIKKKRKRRVNKGARVSIGLNLMDPKL